MIDAIQGVEFNKIKIRTLTKEPFVASVAMKMSIHITDRLPNGQPVPTACLFNDRLYFNPEFYNKLIELRRMTLVMHEFWHKALGHDLRRGDKDPYLWNVACDYIVNLLLLDGGFEPIEGWYCDEKYRGWSEERVYNELVANKEEPPPIDGPGEPCDDGSPSNQPKDEPDDQTTQSESGYQNADANEPSDGSEQSPDGDSDATEDGNNGDDGNEGEIGEGQSSGPDDQQGSESTEGKSGGSNADDNPDDGDEPTDSADDSEKGSDSDTTEGDEDTEDTDSEGNEEPEPEEGEGDQSDVISESMNDPRLIGGEVLDATHDDGTPFTEDEVKKELEKIKEDLVMTKNFIESSGNTEQAGQTRVIDRLIQPRNNWKNQLQQFFSNIGDVCGRSYHAFDRRSLQRGTFDPIELRESIDWMVVLWDVSGSMDWRAHRALLSHLDTIRKRTLIKKLSIVPFNQVVQWSEIVELSPNKKLPTRFSVGGGTRFASGFNWIKRQRGNPDGIVVFTDLGDKDYGDKPKSPVIWVSSDPVYDYGEGLTNKPPFGSVVEIELTRAQRMGSRYA